MKIHDLLRQDPDNYDLLLMAAEQISQFVDPSDSQESMMFWFPIKDKDLGSPTYPTKTRPQKINVSKEQVVENLRPYTLREDYSLVFFRDKETQELCVDEIGILNAEMLVDKKVIAYLKTIVEQ